MGIGQKGKNLIFLISQPRAGSTMLQRILGNHPDIYTVSEPWLMVPPLIGLTSRWSSPEGREARVARENVQTFLNTFPGGYNDYFEGLRRMYTYLYARALESSGRRYFLDKTPRYAYFLPELQRAFPEAHFIILFRNPLAVLCSIVNNWTGDNQQLLFRNHGDDLIDVPGLLLVGKKTLAEKCSLVHYEQLVSQPEAEIRKICEKLGLQFFPEMIGHIKDGLPQWHFGDQKVYQHPRPLAEKAQNWKLDIRHPQIWGLANHYLERLGKNTVEQMGYSYQKLQQQLQTSRPPWIVVGWTFLKAGILRLSKALIQPIYLWMTSPSAALFFGEPLFWFLGMRGRRQKIELSQAKRILVVRLDNIGEVVLTTPFLRELRKNALHAWITLIVKPEVYNLVEFCPYVNEVLTYDWQVPSRLSKSVKHLRALKLAVSRLWKRRFDLAISSRWDIDYEHSSFLTYFSGAKQRTAYSERTRYKKYRPRRGYDKLFTHLFTDKALKHEVEYNLGMIKLLGGRIEEDGLELWPDKDDEDLARSILKKNNLARDSSLVGIGIGASALQKRWPIERFLELIRWFLKESDSTKILILGDKNEVSLCDYIKRHLDRNLLNRVIDVAGLTTLRQTAALLKQCSLYVGNDSGPKHIAAALKVPVVEISNWPKSGYKFSDYSPYRHRPWKVRHILVSPDASLSPCQGECQSSKPHCILQVTAEDAKEAIKKLNGS